MRSYIINNFISCLFKCTWIFKILYLLIYFFLLTFFVFILNQRLQHGNEIGFQWYIQVACQQSGISHRGQKLPFQNLLKEEFRENLNSSTHSYISLRASAEIITHVRAFIRALYLYPQEQLRCMSLYCVISNLRSHGL